MPLVQDRSLELLISSPARYDYHYPSPSPLLLKLEAPLRVNCTSSTCSTDDCSSHSFTYVSTPDTGHVTLSVGLGNAIDLGLIDAVVLAEEYTTARNHYFKNLAPLTLTRHNSRLCCSDEFLNSLNSQQTRWGARVAIIVCFEAGGCFPCFPARWPLSVSLLSYSSAH